MVRSGFETCPRRACTGSFLLCPPRRNKRVWPCDGSTLMALCAVILFEVRNFIEMR